MFPCNSIQKWNFHLFYIDRTYSEIFQAFFVFRSWWLWLTDRENEIKIQATFHEIVLIRHSGNRQPLLLCPSPPCQGGSVCVICTTVESSVFPTIGIWALVRIVWIKHLEFSLFNEESDLEFIYRGKITFLWYSDFFFEMRLWFCRWNCSDFENSITHVWTINCCVTDQSSRLVRALIPRIPKQKTKEMKTPLVIVFIIKYFIINLCSINLVQTAGGISEY